ncbi:hypothetical protein K2X85_16550 [bacterium]|nr:hypothetical protein [bacterium]
MTKRVVLYLAPNWSLPAFSHWQEVFSDCRNVTLTLDRHNDSDVALIPISSCEEYGCRTGASDSPLETMYVYDTQKFHPPDEYFPRFKVSNCLFKEEPASFIDAIMNRIFVLARTLHEYEHRENIVFEVINIDCAVLGFWPEWSVADRLNAIRVVRKAVTMALLAGEC